MRRNALFAYYTCITRGHEKEYKKFENMSAIKCGSQSQTLYEVVEGAGGVPIFDAEMSKVLLRDKITGKINFISLTENIIETILQPYGYEIMLPEKDIDVAITSSSRDDNKSEVTHINLSDAANSSRCMTFISNLQLEKTDENTKPRVLEESNGRTPDKGMKSLWTDKSRAMLLYLYKKYKDDFSSNCIKKDDIWAKIACDMKHEGYNFVAAQCKEKMKYMKKKYFKKIDNMGPKSTGAAPVKCENFEELDELFGNKPNVTPVAIASSSRDDNKSEVTQINLSDAEVNKKKGEKERMQ
ncbi:uncharacterized protein [Temnothorax nylanderi]|uniref:uncharacterized protein n=1 Tax=Temnothorax nylanderi TaxID=102681 RepID=UPI003A8A6FC3